MMMVVFWVAEVVMVVTMAVTMVLMTVTVMGAVRGMMKAKHVLTLNKRSLFHVLTHCETDSSIYQVYGRGDGSRGDGVQTGPSLASRPTAVDAGSSLRTQGVWPRNARLYPNLVARSWLTCPLGSLSPR